MKAPDAAPPELATLDALPAAGEIPLAEFRRCLREADTAQASRFRAGESVVRLVHDRTRFIDALILRAWRQAVAPDAAAGPALAAVGGYGRGELHPASDIDLLVLLREPPGRELGMALEGFLTLLWDIGLQVGHGVRTLEDCETAARDDLSVATNLMEARLLAGDARLFQAMRARTAPPRIWPVAAFFSAKLAEQRERHARYHDTAYKLEPNIKESPGGLRDIQMIGWVARRHFGAGTLHDLVLHGFLTEDEYRLLAEGEALLWRIRFALHLLTGRREDRLVFDHQLRLAREFGYRDRPGQLGVEQFMQNYYRTVMELSRLNEMLLELFEAAILRGAEENVRPVNDRFQVRNGLLEVTAADVFSRTPSALLELFHILQQHPGLKGVSPETIRLIRRHRDLIDDRFRADPQNRDLFMAILREPQGVTHELRRMNRYGVLGRYIPAFGAIVGRMQYDLFHAYTVDEHTLFVVSNLRRFALPRFDHEFPLCSAIMQALPKPELAYLAGLFHDIAKGRGGDHSELGARDAEHFCLAHGLSRYDARLVAWLVLHHLDFSVTAQKKDIADPAVIHEFAERVGDQLHLDYLYVLTVADVRATNPELWNSWKASLFRELYETTKRALRRGLENPIDKEELIRDTQQAALALLETQGIGAERARATWSVLPEQYFLRHTPDEIAWHTELLAGHGTGRGELIAVRQSTERGGTAVFLCIREDDAAFARSTAVLDQLGLSILDARIVAGEGEFSLHTYLVLEDTGSPIEDPERMEQIRCVLARELHRDRHAPMTVTRRAPRQVRLFDTPTRLGFSEDVRNRHTVLELMAGDRPGLLSAVGQAFSRCQVRVHNAKITTVGERAEDVFFLTDRYNRPLETAACRRLQLELERQLDTLQRR